MYNDPTMYPYPPVQYHLYPAHPYHYAPYWAWDRDFPPVDTKILSHSAVTSEHLLKDASLLVKKLADPAIAQQLMTSAQTGNQKEVDRIVHTFGSQSAIETSYTPTAIQFVVGPRMTGSPCCKLTLMLKWGQ
ncbi:hypothetical protein [Paenibacillus roseipurpureus]|uniref:Uncharacterized protein n=1 Tax=Paenibacillus roseopurpureus TaxID=2918901 RepID=A0AA96LPK4_9BACL|nr:hypothetical protein [Paenibacillus sp. MBLB1832]WNR44903.1 hypothetical protein MJB10_01755 [Paenibacillus sp. MBLB1832]